jgi:methionyl-tRNA formyltransferase
MKVGIIGRTHLLIETAKALHDHGHEIAFVYTCQSEAFYKAKEPEFEILAKNLNVPFFCDTRINNNASLLSKFNAELAVSINWLTLLKSELLNTFKFGVLNAHAGDLPRYKGNACPNWAILNFEKRIGLTIHKMVEELDSGPYLLKAFYELNENTYIGDIYKWLENTIPALFVDAIDKIEKSGFIEQDAKIKSLRTFPRKPEDSKINWADSTKNILALIRASSHPFEGAFTYLERQNKIHIFRAKVFNPDFDFSATPGQVCMRAGENPVIATSDGMIEIEECKEPGHDILSTKMKIYSSLRNRLS